MVPIQRRLCDLRGAIPGVRLGLTSISRVCRVWRAILVPNAEFALLLLMGDSDPAWTVREVVQRVVVRILPADSAIDAQSHRIQLLLLSMQQYPNLLNEHT